LAVRRPNDDPSKYDAEDLKTLERSKWFQDKSMGYFKEQSTQPQTIGYSLADSPVGLLAWIYEKLVTWSDAYPWDDDEGGTELAVVLTWISIFWFSRSGPTASIRVYYEVGWAQLPDPSIPVGYTFFPNDIGMGPKSWYNGPNVVFQGRHKRGGHFGAYEQPAELVGDLRKMYGKGGPAYGVVSGKDGYA
ncbi:hypothetical protein MPER_12080, partial [Moniliophthora perniciosa FA553]